MPSLSRARLLGPLGRRLALAFLAVAVGALALLSGLVVRAAERDVSRLVGQERDVTLADVADAAGAAYAEAGGWDGADLDAVVAVSDHEGADVEVLDAAGETVGGSPVLMKSAHWRAQDVVVAGERVGTVRLDFDAPAPPSAEQRLRDALVTTVATGAGLAALLALAVAILVSRRITRPVVALTATIREMEAGDRAARVGPVAISGELGELATAFDRMADTLVREESLRRAHGADVAHELRTPLAMLRGTLEGMADGVVEAGPAELSLLHDDVLRLTRIVDDLGMLAAAEAAGLSLDTNRVDLGEVAAGAAEQLEPHFDASGVALAVRLAPVLVEGDPQRLHQVVVNLLTNALKFTPAGGTTRVEVEADGGGARLTVTDTGVGIPPEELPHIFDRFWRGAQARTAAGSGIGLTVVAELVQAHRGTVAAESEPGAGTRIIVTLPKA
jgi:two-component system, OmpR family, sensor histidine kinase BaeS